MSAEGEKSNIGKIPEKPIQIQVQALMLNLEGKFGATILKVLSFVAAFILLAVWFDLERNHGFGNTEAIEAAQLGRQVATGKGYTTQSIRPLAVGLLQRADPSRAGSALQGPVPDLSIPPGYPLTLAVLMKTLPFRYLAESGQRFAYQPELLIDVFNQLLFFAAILVVFRLAQRLFDKAVAWVSAVILLGSGVYWQFCVSGLSTMLLILLFLALVCALMQLEERERREIPPPVGASLRWAAAAGALVGFGALCRYSFAWLIIPTLIFVATFVGRMRVKFTITTSAVFLLFFAPWMTRNFMVSRTPFGTAGYAWLEDTRPREEDRMERAFDPLASGQRFERAHAMIGKFLQNESKLLQNELPRLGGNWGWAFFLCSLLLPFRNPRVRRMRIFLLCALAIMALAEPLGRTELSVESPEINSESLLVIVAPLALVFGVGFFFTLLEHVFLPYPWMRTAAAAAFAAIMCAPIALSIVGTPDPVEITPYAPYQIQRTAKLLKRDEFMMSDVPWAVAWYGDRACSWLTLDDAETFEQMNKLRPIKAIYLTERTSDRPFLTQVLDSSKSWGRFYQTALPPGKAQGTAPGGFPLTKVISGYVPIQLFLSDTARWDGTTTNKLEN